MIYRIRERMTTWAHADIEADSEEAAKAIYENDIDGAVDWHYDTDYDDATFVDITPLDGVSKNIDEQYQWVDGWDLCCIDCAVIIANDDDSGMTEERAAEVRKGIAGYINGCERDTVVVEGDAGFSMQRCAVCRTTLGGDRMYVKAI